MHSVTSTFNNRELALAVWGLVFVVWAARNSGVRAATGTLLRALFQWKVLLVFAAMGAYVLSCVLLLRSLGVWDVSALKDTIYWFLGTAFVMFVNYSDAENAGYFRKAMLDCAKLIVPLEFLTNLYVFPLWLELCCIPLVMITVATRAYADVRKQDGDKIASQASGKVLEIYGAAVVTFTLYHVATDFSGFATMSNARDFLLPIQLTFLLMPFIYSLALATKYESTFLRFSIFVKDEELLRYAKRRVLMRFHLDLYGLSRWSRQNPLLEAKTKQELEVLICSKPGQLWGQHLNVEDRKND
jgi:hypothetical protein